MNKFFFNICLCIMLSVTLQISAQKNIYIHKNDGNAILISPNKIDSITFSKNTNGQYIQSIWSQNKIDSINANDISDMSFVPNGSCYKINEKLLGDWNEGIICDSMYLVYQDNANDSVSYTYINNINNDQNIGLLFQFNSENNLCGISCKGHYYSVSCNDSIMIIYRIVNGCIEQESRKINKVLSSKGNNKKKIELLKLYGKITKANDILNNIKDFKMFMDEISNRQWGDFLSHAANDIAELGANTITNSMGICGGLALAPVTIVQDAINQSVKNNSEKIYNNSSVEISEIRKGQDGRLEVSVAVHGINTIPPYIARNYSPETLEETKNNVYCGVIGRSAGLPTYHLYTNGYKSTEIELNTDNTNGTCYYTFYMNDVPCGQTYKFRPYLKSTRIKNIWGDVDEGFIKYGEPVDYTGFDGQIIEFKQSAAKYYADSSNTGEVKFKCSIHAKIRSLDDVNEWGVYVYKNGIYETYPSEDKVVENWIDIDFNIKKADFDAINFQDYIATKNIKIGVYKKMNNPTGFYEYLTNYFSEAEEYELSYNVKPQVTFSDAKIINTTIKESLENGDVKYHTTFSFKITITGAFWINYIQYTISQNLKNNWSPAYINVDKVIKWNAYNDYTNKCTVDSYYTIMLNNNTTIFSTNSLHTEMSGGSANISIYNQKSNTKELVNTKQDISQGQSNGNLDN